MTKHPFLKKTLAIAFVLVSCFYVLKFHMGTEQNKLATQSYHNKISQIQKSSHQYSNNTVKSKLRKNEPNLPKVEASAKQRVYRGTGLAYSHCQYNNQFNKSQSQISKYLGTSFGNQVISNVRPYSGKASHTPVSLAQHEQNVQIGFGKFDPMNDTLAMNVLVTFTTNKNANIQYNINSYHHKSFTYYASYQIAYKPNNKPKNQFVVEHFDCGANSNQPYPSKF